jgi:hypothetical protein
MEPSFGWLRTLGEPIGVKMDTLGCKWELMPLKDFVALQCKHLTLLLKVSNLILMLPKHFVIQAKL